MEDIIESKVLRPYFLKYISRKFVLGLAEVHEIASDDYKKFEKEMNSSLYELVHELSKYTTKDPFDIVSKASWYYLSSVIHWKTADNNDFNPSS